MADKPANASHKLSPLGIIKELSKSIVSITNNQKALLQLLEMVEKLEERIDNLEKEDNKKI